MKYGIPLGVFDSCYLGPYVALQHIDYLLTLNSYVIGSSNMLFITGTVPADVIVTLDGKLEWKNKELEKIVSLTSKDRQFIDYIIEEVGYNDRQVQNTGVESSFSGSDTWIRNMFRFYTKCLLSSEVNSDFGIGNTKNISNFSEKFRLAWSSTSNYQKWRESVSLDIGEESLAFHPGFDAKTLMQTVSSKASSIFTNNKKNNYLIADSDDLDELPELKSTQSVHNLPNPMANDQSSHSHSHSERKLMRGLSLNNVFGNTIYSNSKLSSPHNNNKKLKTSITLRSNSDKGPIEVPEETKTRAVHQNSHHFPRDRTRQLESPGKPRMAGHKGSIPEEYHNNAVVPIAKGSKSYRQCDTELPVGWSPRPRLGGINEEIPEVSNRPPRSLPGSVSSFYLSDSSSFSAPNLLGTRRGIRCDIEDPLTESENKDSL